MKMPEKVVRTVPTPIPRGNRVMKQAGIYSFDLNFVIITPILNNTFILYCIKRFSSIMITLDDIDKTPLFARGRRYSQAVLLNTTSPRIQSSSPGLRVLFRISESHSS
jgi:hypothetical protein